MQVKTQDGAGAIKRLFDKIDKNQAQKNEEERILTEFKRRLDAARGVLDKAATKLQARARGGLAQRAAAPPLQRPGTGHH